MAEHSHTSETSLPAPINEVFAFFSSAENLERITPPSLGFHIRSPLPIVMGEGTLIDYSLSLRGIPLRWRTLISRWRPPFEFVDEQLRGPYRLWIHHHSFETAADGGTLMRDHVRYGLPFAPFGEIARPLVRAEVGRIFAYRNKAIREIFRATES